MNALPSSHFDFAHIPELKPAMPQFQRWSGTQSVKGSTELVRMALLSASMVGVQLVWGLEMAYAMPYLLDLGLSKSSTTFVWVAGPLSGLIVAPIVGAVADRSKSKWGRRRPFMLIGCAVVAFWFYVLGWAGDVVDSLMGPLPPSLVCYYP